jgi:hypothetical protein
VADRLASRITGYGGHHSYAGAVSNSRKASGHFIGSLFTGTSTLMKRMFLAVTRLFFTAARWTGEAAKLSRDASSF